MDKLINAIKSIVKEDSFIQIGSYPIYLNSSRFEIKTPLGIKQINKYSWRILDYLNMKRPYSVPIKELCFHVFEFGDEFCDKERYLRVLICNLRRAFREQISDSVIEKNGHNFQINDVNNVSIQGLQENFLITVNKEWEEKCREFYYELRKYISCKYAKELKNTNSYTNKNRYYFLKYFVDSRVDFSSQSFKRLIGKIRFEE